MSDDRRGVSCTHVVLLAPLGLVLVVHENAAFFQRAQSQVLGRLWVQLQQILELLAVEVHRARPILYGLHLGLALVSRRERLERDVALQIEKQLVVVEEGVGGKLHELGPSLREHIDLAGEDEHHFLGFTAVALDLLVRRVDARVQLDHKLVAEALLARIEEVFEPAHEPPEDLVDELSLHLGGQLLVQSVLFHNQVEVEVEGVGDGVLDQFAESGRYVVGLVG